MPTRLPYLSFNATDRPTRAHAYLTHRHWASHDPVLGLDIREGRCLFEPPLFEDGNIQAVRDRRILLVPGSDGSHRHVMDKEPPIRVHLLYNMTGLGCGRQDEEASFLVLGVERKRQRTNHGLSGLVHVRSHQGPAAYVVG